MKDEIIKKLEQMTEEEKSAVLIEQKIEFKARALYNSHYPEKEPMDLSQSDDYLDFVINKMNNNPEFKEEIIHSYSVLKKMSKYTTLEAAINVFAASREALAFSSSQKRNNSKEDKNKDKKKDTDKNNQLNLSRYINYNYTRR